MTNRALRLCNVFKIMAGAAAAPVQPQHGQAEFGFFVVDGGAALAAGQVQTTQIGRASCRERV